MFTIGRFADLTGVSAKRLRHYDRLGLFRPAFVDPSSRYRYYLASQIPGLQRIVALRDLGLSLRTIARIAREEPGALQAALEQRRRELITQQERLARNLAALEIEVSPAGGHDVVVRTRPRGRWASRRVGLETGDDIGAVFVAVETIVRDAGIRARLPPAAVDHGRTTSGRSDVEVLVPITRPLPPDSGVAEVTTPAVPVAAMLVEGGYPRRDRATRTIREWADTAGYEVTGPVWVVYLRFSAEPELRVPDEFLSEDGGYVTEIQAPVRWAGGA